MSISISFIGTFKNGKTRSIGSLVSTNGLDDSQLYLNQEDLNFINRMIENENKNFNWCIENNKFRSIEVFGHLEGKQIYYNHILLPLKRIYKEDIIKYIKEVNTAARSELINNIYTKAYYHLTEEEKEKVFNKWAMMQPISNKENFKKIFNDKISYNSRVDKYYNIIFNL